MKYDLPPDSEPSDTLLFRISEYSVRGKPLRHLSRIYRVSPGYILEIKRRFIDKKDLPAPSKTGILKTRNGKRPLLKLKK